ncbi:reverse transcriptase domain-containing protein [Sphingomonas sp. PAMC 26617]|uniref:reverse transcriptase domain-containing protein n=1 Tax=Sphingomonas sp. PAMC 26617 TaxID=1112216 RepID=UPI001E4781FC|nr:reverse transcriptase domain-containing protein [Sphingomonas sp. PAMC 26617]
MTMKSPSWFRPRGYLHLDVPVALPFAESLTPAFVASHTWSPLIHYVKTEKRYKALERKTIKKTRPIMYASHRDACILSKYSADLASRLDTFYKESQLDDTVVAYRSLGQSNYHFAKRVEDYVRSQTSLTVMCFDVTGFFDNLDHRLLKRQLKWILGCKELPADWYAVFNIITKFRHVNLEQLKEHEPLAKRIKARRPHPLATIKQLNELKVAIHKNTNTFGIPQGTPISASISNLYMAAFDLALAVEVGQRGGLYQRYSDDILIACHPTCGDVLEKLVEDKLHEHGLQLQKAKTERVTLAGTSTLTFQYLGYQLGHVDARLRLKSLSRQWRTARRAIKKTERVGGRAVAMGQAKQVYTKKLHRRFTDAGPRNFLAYAERSADTLQSQGIKKQAKKLRRYVHSELARIRGKLPPKPR